jgi:hypothetical protein
VSVVYGFGFVLSRVDPGWRLRGGGSAEDDEELPGLEEAVVRGLERYRAYREAGGSADGRPS